MTNRLLIADDEENMRWAIKNALKSENYTIFEAVDGNDAIEQFQAILPDAMLLDIRMPKKNGLEVLKAVKKIKESIPVIILSAHGDVDTAIEAMNNGAMDFITKPFDINELKATLKKAVGYNSLEKELEYFRGQSLSNVKIIGNSPEILQVLDLIRKVADSDSTVLITGQSGTGKEMAAKAIHNASSRKNSPFVAVNCGAIPETLIESELFGHKKGSFTGAHETKIGKFEVASGGTLFLDEIGEINQAIQVKLLRFLQERVIEKVGSTETQPVDVRVIAATNKNLLEMTKDNSFREDLYYRLNVIPINLPPLQARNEDIPELANHFIDKHSKHIKKQITGLSDIAMKLIQKYSWPGNIRELENVIERAIILAEGETITPDLLPSEIIKKEDINETDGGKYILPKEGIVLEDLEKELIIQALENTNNNKTQAAALLGLTRQALIYRIDKFKIATKSE